MPKLLAEVYRLQAELTDLDAKERRLLKMFAHLLESHYDVKEPRNRLTFEEYERSQDGGSYSTACCKITEGALEGFNSRWDLAERMALPMPLRM
ncbi:MAG TPA: hypothetical protein VEV85_16425 [Bryobacteraceae bacterium]|nr:hypothetical protein [Bryobacteraceae bacterium]